MVAAGTSKIARASFMGTLVRSIGLCGSLFVLMAAVFLRPEMVLEPGLAQLAATGLVLAATVGLTFSVQARFASNLVVDLAARVVLAGFALVALAHPDPWGRRCRVHPGGGVRGVLAPAPARGRVDRGGDDRAHLLRRRDQVGDCRSGRRSSRQCRLSPGRSG